MEVGHKLETKPVLSHMADLSSRPKDVCLCEARLHPAAKVHTCISIQVLFELGAVIVPACVVLALC